MPTTKPSQPATKARRASGGQATATERQARQRAQGRAVSTVLTDPTAIARWDALLDTCASQREALTLLLVSRA